MAVVRFEKATGAKTYRPFSREAGGNWRLGDPEGPLPLYQLPALLSRSQETAYVVEGEKAADALESVGILATTSAHGSQSAGKTDWTPLAGRNVVVVPDNDEPGEKYAAEVIAILHDRGVAEVRVLRLHGLPEQGDAADFIEEQCSHGKTDERIRSEVYLLAEQSPTVGPKERGPQPVIVCLRDIKARDVRWLWPKFFPLGKVSILVGDPDLGKSTLTTDIAARVSRGLEFPDGSGKAPQGSVIILSAEDAPEDTIKPRLMVAGADESKIHILKGVREPGSKDRGPVLLDKHVGAIELALRRFGDVRLIIIDPVSAYLGSTKAIGNSEVRAVLARLQDLAQRYDVAILLISHLNKAQGAKAKHRVMESMAFVAAARSGWLVAEHPESKDLRVLVRLKGNLAAPTSGMSYRVVGDDFGSINTGRIQWHDSVELTAEDVLAQPTRPNRPNPVDQWLLEILGDGPVLQQTILNAGREEGFTEGRIRRAKKRYEIKHRKRGYGGPTEWYLRDDLELDELVELDGVQENDPINDKFGETAHPGADGTPSNESEGEPCTHE
jgi:KaiC/GvpD/RAD55 family RecA-like ATPase